MTNYGQFYNRKRVRIKRGSTVFTFSYKYQSIFQESFALNLILKAMDLGLGNGLFCEADSFKWILRDSVKPQKMTKWREFKCLCLYSTRSTS